MIAHAEFRKPNYIQKKKQIARPARGWLNATRWTLLLTALTFSWLLYRYIFQPAWVVAAPELFLELLGLVEWGVLFTIVALWFMIVWQKRRRAVSNNPALPLLTVVELGELSPAAFEAYTADVFRAKGYTAKLRGRSGDMGVDVEVVSALGRKAIVQCKRYHHTVGSETVRELYGTLLHERAAHAFLVTSAEISSAARKWAQNKPMTLIDGDTLVSIVESLKTK